VFKIGKGVSAFDGYVEYRGLEVRSFCPECDIERPDD